MARDWREGRPAAARLASRSAASRRGSSSWSMRRLGPCSAAPSSGPMMTRPGGRSNRSVAPADSAGVACGAAAPRGPTRGSRGSRRIRRERCSEGASCCDADGCSRASVRAPQRRSRRARACRGRLGAPPARAGARGRAWAGQISRADALERTARLAGTQQPRRSCAGRRGGSGTISPTGRDRRVPLLHHRGSGLSDTMATRHSNGVAMG